MSAKPAKRNWNDVQIAIVTASIVTAIGMWNLFATPAKAVTAQATDPAVPPTDPPTDAQASAAPTALSHVKIMFTPGSAQQTITTAALPLPQQPGAAAAASQPKKSRGGGGSAPAAHTKTS